MNRHQAIASFIIAFVKLLAPLFLAGFLCSCTTLPSDVYNRRDLYSPGPAPYSHKVTRQTTITSEIEPTPEPKPEFR